MKITYNWLKDFVDIKLSPQALAEKLTMAGIEVGSIEEKDGDFIFEIEITSNRPDWLSAIGLAREVAAIQSSKFKFQSSKFLSQYSIRNTQYKKAKEYPSLKIEIESRKDCPLYTAKIIRGVTVGPSPGWLKSRLEKIGCRSVNNVVDITNYVLFTYGEPLHAFDLDKLNSGTIEVRRARQGEKITIIDGQEKTLGPGTLVIANGSGTDNKAVAVAGVMGGKDTEVTFATKNVLLEAAIFNPVVIRCGRRELGVQTDSSYRFERGIDIGTALLASKRAADLILQEAGGECVLDKSAGKIKEKQKIIHLSPDQASKVLGVKITIAKIKAILNNLGFTVKQAGRDALSISVPLFRQDINLEIDLIEEVARIFGYEHIPVSSPYIKPKINIRSRMEQVSLIKNTLVGLGLTEVITYSLIDREALVDFGLSADKPVEVQNPLSKEQEILRPSIIPSLGRCIAYNLNQKQNYVNIFEIAKIFPGWKADMPKEELVLGLGVCGERARLVDSGRVIEELGFLQIKGTLEAVFERLGLEDYRFIDEERGEIRISISGEEAGVVTRLKRDILNKLDIKNQDVTVAELSLEKILGRVNLKRKFTPLPVFPRIARDISMLLRNEIKIGEVFGLIEEKAGAFLKDVKVTDLYKGKQIPNGFKGLTISCLYGSDERTLTEEEINPLHSRVLEALKERFGAQLR